MNKPVYFDGTPVYPNKHLPIWGPPDDDTEVSLYIVRLPDGLYAHPAVIGFLQQRSMWSGDRIGSALTALN